jgi:hypothetical protein
MKTRRSRGQSLVLFSLTLMLLALMVLLTVSMGLRVREKMELQTLADAAAYSDAVATARTFNVIAVMNRTEWSLLVAQTATQAYISWASAYRGSLNVLRSTVYPLMQAELALCQPPYRIPPAQIKMTQWMQKLNQELQRVEQVWDGVDRAASAQVRGLNGLQAAMYQNDFAANYTTLDGLIRSQNLARTIVEKAQGSSIWTLEAPEEGSKINLREISKNCSSGAVCDPMPSSNPQGGNSIDHQYEIYMGSRGDAFTTGRAGGAGMITARLNVVFAGFTGAAVYGGDGAAYRSDQFDGPLHGAEGNPGAAQSDDHGDVSWAGLMASCPVFGTGSVEANVLANLSSNADRHTWSGGTCQNQDDTTHSLIGDIAGGNWPIVYDYNENKLSNKDDLQGQPKLYSLITRDYSKPTKDLKTAAPWIRNFNFSFSPNRTSRFDNRGLSTDDGKYDIRKQATLATGLAYYHRSGDWAEPPNFMNPFWRATLVAPDIDAQGKGREGDIAKTLENAGLDVAKQTYQALHDAKFGGWQ